MSKPAENPPSPLEGELALVTGASRGIGRAVALALADAGADLVLCARTTGALAAVGREVEGTGRRATVLPLDVGDAAAISAAARRLADGALRPTIVVNNAATGTFGPLLQTNPADWERMFRINVTGPFLLLRELVPLMQQAGGGAIVNVASVAGIEPAYALGAYAVTKAAVIHMTRLLAFDLARFGIRVNAVAPGLVETEMAKGLLANEKFYGYMMATTAQRRHAQPEEIAPTVVHLVSDAASFITGQVVAIDGGRGN